MREKNRNISLDIARGVGIILVVIGHVMSPVMAGNTVMETAYQILYVFHMPLFFLLAGLVAPKLIGGGYTSSRSELIKHRATRLMIPYFTWAVIYEPMKMLMKEQVRFQYDYSLWTLLIGNNPDGQLWFLYVLFILSVVSILFVNEKNLKWWCIAAVCTSAAAPIIPSTIGLPGITLSFSMYQVGFFFLGMLLIPQRDCFFKNGKIALLCAAIWIVLSVMHLCNISIWWLKALAASCACYCILYLSSAMSTTKVAKGLSYLGKNSMDIYIIHAPILVVGRTVLRRFGEAVPWAYVAVMSAAAVALSLVISRCIIQRVRLFRLLLLGTK